MGREVAIFINRPAAERAAQAAIQEQCGTYHLHVRTRRGQFIGYAVELRPATQLDSDQRVYIME